MSDHPPVPPGQPGPQDPSTPQGQGQPWQQQPGGAPQWSGQPTPAGAPAPPSSDAFGRLLQSLTGRDWLASVLAGVGGWVAAYVVAGLSLLLTVAVAATGSSGSTLGSGSVSGSGSELGTGGAPDVQSLLSGVSVLLGAPAQLVAMADLGRLHGSGSVGLLGSGSGSLAVVPVLVLAAQVVLAVVLTRRIRSRALGRWQVVVLAVVSGLVTTVLVNAFAGLLAIRFPDLPGIEIEPVHAVGFSSVVGAFLIGALAALLARPSVLIGGRTWSGRVLGAVRVAASQAVVLVVVVAVAVVVVALVTQPSWGAALPVFIGNVAVAVTALGFFGGLGTAGLGSGGDSATVFDGAGGWTWLAVLLVLATSVAAGLALAVRRNDRVRSVLDWVVTPVVWFALGLLLFVLGTGIVSYEASGYTAVGGSGSLGVTPWTPFVFLLWGGLVEAVARYLAPVLLPRLGGGVVLAVSRLVGADPRPLVSAPAGAAAPAGAFPDAPAQGGAFPGGPAQGGAFPDAPSQPGAFPGGPAQAGAAPGAFPGAPTPTGAQSWSTGGPVDPAASAWGATPGVAQPAQPFIGGDGPAPKPMSARSRKILVRSLVAGGVVVVVVIAGAVTAGVLRSNVWGPGATVKSYVQAIERGDADAAGRLSDQPDDATMLDSTVLKSAKDRPTDVRVGRVATSGDNAIATISYTQGGKNRSGQIGLRRTGTSFVVKDEWRIVQPLAQIVTLTASEALEGAPVTIGGKEVGKIADGRFQSLAYPGTYGVEVGGTEYFTGGKKSVTVGPRATDYIDFQPTPTKALHDDVDQYVSDLIEECAAKTDISALSDCPWYGPYDADGAVRYDVTTMPEIELEASGTGNVIVQSTKDGVVEYDYTSYTGDREHGEDEFAINEYLKVEDGELVSAY